jgi:uncharacterized protein
MTNFRVERFGFTKTDVDVWGQVDPAHSNWPVVYVLDGKRVAYVGETLSAAARLRQHLASKREAGLRTARVVIDETFNKSACLDLESHLIRWLDGDDRYTILNGNQGITDADYYDRARYRSTFDDIFEELRAAGVFQRSIQEIENSDLFKLSPFKALTPDQAIAVEQIVEDLIEDLHSGATVSDPTRVVEGYPGTGKTVVAIYIMKLLADIAGTSPLGDIDPDMMFADFFTAENRELLASFKMAIVVPQQALRTSIRRVFAKTRGLSGQMVLSPFEVGESTEQFDLLLVDEAHRLNQRANQSSGIQNRRFIDINVSLFGDDDLSKTQLDWILAKSANQILMLDSEQTVRPADLPVETTRRLSHAARASHRYYPLTSQLRVKGGQDYITFARELVRGEVRADTARDFGSYDLRLFDSAAGLRSEIRARDSERGLARVVAGYAWDWKSKRDRDAVDIELDGVGMRWNSTDKDWISSPGAIDEVGSIHTVQGYDLNYAGVIIGPDLRYDPAAGRIVIDRDAYRDAKGKENNRTLGKEYSDEELLGYITNIYAVLLTRGIRGTYVYVCDPHLRDYIKKTLAAVVR